MEKTIRCLVFLCFLKEHSENNFLSDVDRSERLPTVYDVISLTQLLSTIIKSSTFHLEFLNGFQNSAISRLNCVLEIKIKIIRKCCSWVSIQISVFHYLYLPKSYLR